MHNQSEPKKKTVPGIIIRNFRFQTPEQTNHRWLNESTLASSVFTALSLTFPLGEQSFADSVRHYMGQIEDPELRDQIKRFLAQEALHSEQHQNYNQWIDSFGLNVKELQSEFEEEFKADQVLRTPIQNLALTVALEHMTAILAYAMLSRPAVQAAMHPEVRSLWIYHSIEELEHKAVAFDVFKKVGGSYWTRIRWMLSASYHLIRISNRIQAKIVHRDLKLYHKPSITKAFWFFWTFIGPQGFITKIIPRYLAYYRPGFHPNNTDETALVQHWSEQLKKELPPLSNKVG